MSMLALGRHHTPAGAFPSAERRAIVAHLKAHGPTSTMDLDQMLKRTVEAYADDSTLTQLRRHLNALARAGHIHCARTDENGQRVWEQGTSRVVSTVATSRQVMVLDTSVYQPAPGPAMRSGATDFLRIPSVLLGHRTDYRSSLQ